MPRIGSERIDAFSSGRRRRAAERDVRTRGAGPGETIPVMDRMGLAGHFDFEIPQSMLPLPAQLISSSLEKQLGLTLNPVKDVLSCIVVDHVDKIRAIIERKHFRESTPG